MPIRSFLDLDVYQRAYKAAIIVRDELIETYNIIGKQLFRLGKSWNSTPSPTLPDSPPTARHHTLFALPTSLALKIPGYSSIPISGNAPDVGISPILQTGVTLLLVFAVLLTLFFLIYGGISFIISGGDKQKVVAARLKLTYAVVGLIIVLLSFFIVNVIGGIFGVNLLSIPLPEPSCIGSNCIIP